MSLEHIVDVVLQLKETAIIFTDYYVLRKTVLAQLTKLVFLKMTNTGLKEINDPGEYPFI